MATNTDAIPTSTLSTWSCEVLAQRFLAGQAKDAAAAHVDEPLITSVHSASTVIAADLWSVRSFLRATAGTAIARLSHRNSVRLSVRPSVCHTGGSGKNGAS